ncbi:MAG: response regulator, partial [Anaerolineales bacterium]
SSSVREEIAAKVLRHFERNSRAMDSVEGIAHFWVGADHDLVAQTLTDLHARGLLEKRTIAGTDFYSLQRTPRLQPDPLAEAAATQEETARPSGARVLVVDDDPPVLRLLVDTLRLGGFDVTATDSAERAIDRFQANPHDVVLTDVRMKGVSGLQLLRTIRQISPSTEVVVITGHATLDTAMEALHEGAYDLITQPLDDIDSLQRIVGRAAEKRRLTSDNRILVETLSAHNARLKDAVARLAAVNEVGRTTTRQLDAARMYQSLAELVAQHLEARRVSILISEPASDTLTVVASVGITERDVLNTQVRLGDGIAGRVAASQAALLVQDIEKTELRRYSAGGRYNTPSFLITPLSVSCAIRQEQRWAGVITASDKHSG